MRSRSSLPSVAWFAVAAAILAMGVLIAFVRAGSTDVGTQPVPSARVAPSPTAPTNTVTTSPTSTPSPSPSAAATTAPPISVPPRPTLPAGTCTTPTTSARALVDNYLGLTTSGDNAAVRDCFDPAYVAAHGFNGRWSSAGPIATAVVTLRYPLRGCQWFEVRADFVNGSPDGPAQGGATYFRFLAVGRVNGSLRIVDQTTALVRQEFENDPSVALPLCAP